MRIRGIIHRAIRKRGHNFYLCNQAYYADPHKTDLVAEKEITCKNCLKILKYKYIKRHKELHRALDELTGDYILHTNNLPSKTALIDLMRWSHKQTIKPEGEWDIIKKIEGFKEQKIKGGKTYGN